MAKAMISTVTGIVEKPADAQRIIEDLQATCLCDRADISLLHRDSGQFFTAARTAIDSSAAAATSVVDLLFQGSSSVSRSLPGGSFFRAIGEFGTRLANAGIGTGADIARALLDAGVSQAEARRSGDAIDRGGVLIVVQARTEKVAQCARTVMATHGAVDPATAQAKAA